MSKPPARVIYEFGDFRLDAGHLMLCHRDNELPLSPKAVETLVALLERRGEIVSKDELLEIVWPDAIVEESNLFLYLSVLRKTLGTQDNGKPWVETLRRRGYRFSGDVQLVPIETGENGTHLNLVPDLPPAIQKGSDVNSDEVPNVHTPEPRGWARPVFTIVAALTLVVALAFTFPYVTRTRQIGSIAVLPFVNESGDAELDYLSEGMTDNLIGSLGKIPQLDVKASSTMFRYKGSDLDAATIGKNLNVEAVLSPRMVQRGDELTLYLELVDSRTENSLWQQTYKSKLDQIGLLQRDVIRDVVRALSIDLTDSTDKRIAGDYTESAEATRLYLKGQFLVRKITEPQVREGLVYLRQATEHDPSYALAFAMISNAHRSLILCCDVHPSELAEAKATARRALELDENLSEAHSAVASNLYFSDWNFPEAEKHFQRALELDPKSAQSHFLYGDFLGRMGRADEATVVRSRALELEPYSPRFNAFSLNQGDPNTALERAQFAIDLDPNFYFSHFMAAGVYARKKMYPEAIAGYRRAKELAPEQTWTDVGHSRTLIEMGEIDQARAILDELLLRSKSRYVPAFHIATIYNQLGDTEQALAWLEKAYQVRDPKMTFLKIMPTFKSLEADPRFQDLKRRVGF